eukprot:10596715-Alexandrium_andersonii.AAC.1
MAVSCIYESLAGSQGSLGVLVTICVHAAWPLAFHLRAAPCVMPERLAEWAHQHSCLRGPDVLRPLGLSGLAPSPAPAREPASAARESR